MALLRVEPYIVDSVGNFVFSSATITSNVTAGNVKTDNLLYANGSSYKVSSFTNDTGYLVAANLTSYATQTDVSNAVSNLVASAPAALDTLNELANALGNDASYSTTITNALANKLSTSSFTSTADTWLGTKTTTNLTEGTNLYYTAARANSAIDARVTKIFVDNLAVVANIANVAYSVAGANVTGQVSNSLIAGTVYTNAQPNITSVGTLTSLTVSGNLSAGNIAGGNLVSANYFSGDGSLLTSITGANVTGTVGNATHATISDSANSVAGANVTGTVASATTSATVTTAAQPNITSVGTLTSLAVTGNLSAGNINGGNLVSANYFSGDGSLLTSITGANITGTVGNATHATVSDSANSVAVANVTGIGNIATINKDGNSSNVLYGNGVFASAPVTYANSNVANYLPTYTGDLSPGNITISSDNLKLSGGTANYVLSTDGTGNLSWVAQSTSSGSAGGESTVTSVDSFTGDGTTTTYTLSVTPQSINQTFINYNGALQLRNSYSLSGANIIFSEAPANGSQFEVTTQMNVTSGSGNLTVRNYTADGVQTTYTVSAGVNATNILVTENGLLQTPSVDYTVTGSTLTFTQAPGYSVKIQIRELGVAVATITPVGSNTQVLFNDAGSFGNSSQFTFSKTSNTLSVGNLTVSSSVVGNLIPSANVTYNLGSSTQRWKDLFLSGNTIDLAGAKIKSDPTTGSIAFVPPTTIDAPNPTALVISTSGAISTSVTTNGVLASNAFSTAIQTGTVTSPRYISMVKTGNITTPDTGTSRYYPPSNVQIRGVTASLSNAASDTFTFTINKNGSNIGAYSISSSQHRLSPASANISLTTSDYLTINVTSGTGASDLRIDLEYTVV